MADRSAGAQEQAAFEQLQSGLPELFVRIVPDRTAPRTIVVVPSLGIDQDVAAAIAGFHHYEERMLGMLMLLRQPRTRVIYLSSQPISETIVDYYLHLLQGVPTSHARERLVMLSCHDGSPQPLTGKVLARPRLLARLQAAIGNTSNAYIAAFAVTAEERALAVQLGIPIYGCDPALAHLGSKSGGRKLMREAGILLPDGVEDLSDEADVVAALTELRARNPGLRRAVVKLNEGVSGEGNAAFDFSGAPTGNDLPRWIGGRLPHLTFEARTMTWGNFVGKIRQMGAVVEAFVEGEEKRSPSTQFRIDPFRRVEPVSTHDQVLEGQVYRGCRFPADEAYRLDIQEQGAKLGALLAQAGALGRFAVDFVSVRDRGKWRNYGIEVNLRKGGTTHPFLMLELLTGGAYDAVSGQFRTRTGQVRHYYASDNIEAPHYKGLTPSDLVDLAVLNGLHYDGAVHEGVVFHLIGALSEFGKLGVVCVGDSGERAEALYRQTVEILDREQMTERQT